MAGKDYFADYIKKIMSKEMNVASAEEGGQLEVLGQINKKIDRLINQGPEISSQLLDLAILNGRLVIPGQGIINANIFINKGKIHSISTANNFQAREVVDAVNKYVLPGIIDPHVHLGLFSSLEGELATESRSALLGGVTTVGVFFSSQESHLKTFPQIEEKINQQSSIDIFPHLIINNNQQKEEIREYVDQLAITSFKLYMNGIPGLIPDVDDAFILDVFDQIKRSAKECIVCVHSENRYLVRRATRMVQEKLGDKADLKNWSETHPEMAEEEAVIRVSYLAEKAKVPVYLVHISSAEAIMRLRQLKPLNKYINVETTSPYLSLTNDSLPGAVGKMEPPFRDFSDVDQLWKALDDGIIDSLGTDNVTLTRDEKKLDQDIWNAMPGYPALSTHLPVTLHEGVIKRGFPLEKIVSLMTKNPAQIFGVYPRKGTIIPGSDADLVVVDLNLSKEVKASDLASRSDFSLYEGQQLQGWPVLTVKQGKIVVKNGEFTASNVRGTVLKR